MKLSIAIIATSILSAQLPMIDFGGNQEILVQNSILATVNENTISMMDVKKKMDLLFHQNYPNLAQSVQAKYQFYEKSWRPVLMELIDQELILADAAQKEIKLSDGEIREEMETRFGPSVLTTLDRIGVTYDEAWKLIKNELIVRRMSWWFVQSRAIQNVTPKAIREAYQGYKEEHPSYTEFKYQVIVIKGSVDPEKLQQLKDCLAHKTPDEIKEECQKIDPSIQISAPYVMTDLNISASHLQVLSGLEPGSYSGIVEGKNRGEKQPVFRIFYLENKQYYPTASFEAMSASLRDQLIQKAIGKESQVYLERLRKQHGFDAAYLANTLPEDFHPFALDLSRN